MCGIAGVISFRDVAPALLSVPVKRMLNKLEHRGPQGSNMIVSDRVSFGIQRLAIRGIDSGTQPLIDAASGVMVVCNGEIDNHLELREWLLERGRPVLQAVDVAVIPGLYLELGDAFIEKLEGVFALAVWDPRTQNLLLARDRAGERSLFYRAHGHHVFFATEIAALQAGIEDELLINKAAIIDYLHRGHFIAPNSPLESIYKIKPGEMIHFSETNMHRRSYWNWQVTTTSKTTPSIKKFDAILRQAIATQSNIDVDFGLFLSGGVDSSLIAAIMKSVHPEKKYCTYTLNFAEKSYDESKFAEAVASYLNLDIVSVLVTPEAFIKELPVLIHQVGEPLADPAWIPTLLLSRRAAEDVRMAFTGEGGDELFGGYPTYLGAKIADRYQRLPQWIRSSLKQFARALPHSDKKMPLSFLLKRFTEGDHLSSYARHQLWTANIKPELLARLGLNKPISLIEPSAFSGTALFDHLQLHDFETSLAEGLLTKTDRGGMSSSLEIRAPFLAHSVMEFAASLPENERIAGYTTKVFLKKYAEQYLPKDIIYRRKRGLSVPLALWLRGPLYQWASDELNSGQLEVVGIKTSTIKALLAEHVDKRADHARILWTLLVLNEWLTWDSSRYSEISCIMPASCVSIST